MLEVTLNLKSCELKLDREREKLDLMIGTINVVSIAEDGTILK